MHKVAAPATHPQGSAGQILEILRDGTPRTRREIAELTGQARTTVSQRLALLESAGLVHETEEAASTGGRPSVAFRFNAAGKAALSIDLGANHATFGVTDLTGTVLAHSTEKLSIALGPAPIMERVFTHVDALLAHPAVAGREVLCMGVGVPGPVDQESGRPTSPPIMPGWDGYDVRGTLAGRYGCPVFVDNDANVLAVGERAINWPTTQDLIYVKVATGIGSGIISGGRLLHGAEGSAGDLGHVVAVAAGDRTCRCGNRGCLESVAGGLSIAASLAAQGIPASSPHDIVDLVREGNIAAIVALREAGRALGEVLSACIALLNPGVIVIGGEIVEVGEPLLAGVRESVYSRALPLASRHLRVAVAEAGELGGVIGAAHLAIDKVFSPEHLGAALYREPAIAG